MSTPEPRPARQVPAAHAAGGDSQLPRLLREAVASVDRLLGEVAHAQEEPTGYALAYRGQLAILRAVLGMQRPLLVPELDHLAPLGHAYRSVEAELGLEPGRGVEPLEGLADLGLLARELHSHVHVCPRCRHFHVNYRETCVGCSSIDIEIERLVHHFHCAYTGLESEFQHGIDLVCPRCRRRLFQLGQDFEWPHDTYVCHDCHRIFEDPMLQAQCVFCAHSFPGKDAELVKIWRYTPTPLAVRAVELNRLTGLDVSAILYDTRLRLATRDFLEIEVEREVYRVQRHGGYFSGALLAFAHQGREYPVFREWHAETIQELGRILTHTLRPLDLVSRLSVSRVALLLPETDAFGASAVERRLNGLLSEAAFSTRAGRPLTAVWMWQTWADEGASREEAMAFFDQAEEPS